MYRSKWNFHTHTAYCDGSGSVAEMAQAAAALHFEALGFSGHAYWPAGESYCMTPATEQAYFREIAAAKAAHAGALRIYAGLELEGQDTRSIDPALDYHIRSVHWVQGAGEWYAVDDSPAMLERCIREGFGGDPYGLAETFFETSAAAAAKHPDIIGHFDLLTKFNAGGRYFDVEHPRYRTAAMEGLRTAVGSGAIFEVNTGAISRGIAGRIYPAPFLLEELYRLGAPVMVNADAHSPAALDCAFETAEALLRQAGFGEVMCLGDHGWESRPLY